MKKLILLSFFTISSAANASMTTEEITNITDIAATKGSYAAYKLIHDISKARTSKSPLTKQMLEEGKKGFQESMQALKAAMAEVKSTQSLECFYAVASATRVGEADGFITALRSSSSAEPKALANEGLFLEYARTAIGGAGISELNDAIAKCGETPLEK